jgi:hypothetical protein
MAPETKIEPLKVALLRANLAVSSALLPVGRDQLKAAMLDLKDQYGRSRLRLVVDSLGESRIEFLDDSGRVTTRLPQ